MCTYFSTCLVSVWQLCSWNVRQLWWSTCGSLLAARAVTCCFASIRAVTERVSTRPLNDGARVGVSAGMLGCTNPVAYYVGMAPIAGRDRAVVQFVARFKQATARQLHAALFSANASLTPVYRALHRLTDDRYLATIERRVVGGAKGGSGQRVYQLGPRGWTIFKSERFYQNRSVDYHALAVVDVFLTLMRLERAGVLQVKGFSIEAEAWRRIGHTDLRPDMLVGIERAGNRSTKWLEIDMGTESQRQIRGKLESYYRAWIDCDPDHGFPEVLWVAVDQPRADELQWLIEQGPKDAQQLFAVTTIEGLESYLS